MGLSLGGISSCSSGHDHELDLAVVKQADLDETVKSLQSVMLAWGLERVIKSWLVK